MSFMALNKSTLIGSKTSGLKKVFYGENNSYMDFANGFASAVDTYLADAEYNGGALLYTSATVPSAFLLSLNDDASSAADKIATGVTAYFLPGVGLPGTPVAGGLSVVSGNILAPTLQATLKAKLLVIFKKVDKTDTLDSKVADIADAIHTSVLTVTTTHIELMPGTPTYPSGLIPGTIA